MHVHLDDRSYDSYMFLWSANNKIFLYQIVKFRAWLKCLFYCSLLWHNIYVRYNKQTLCYAGLLFNMVNIVLLSPIFAASVRSLWKCNTTARQLPQYQSLRLLYFLPPKTTFFIKHLCSPKIKYSCRCRRAGCEQKRQLQFSGVSRVAGATLSLDRQK